MVIPMNLVPNEGASGGPTRSKARSITSEVQPESIERKHTIDMPARRIICLANNSTQTNCEMINNRRLLTRITTKNTKTITAPCPKTINNLFKLISVYICILNATIFLVLIDCQSQNKNQHQNFNLFRPNQDTDTDNTNTYQHELINNHHDQLRTNHDSATTVDDNENEDAKQMDLVPVSRLTMTTPIRSLVAPVAVPATDCQNGNTNNNNNLQQKNPTLKSSPRIFETEQQQRKSQLKSIASSQKAPMKTVTELRETNKRQQRQFGRLTREPQTTTTTTSTTSPPNAGASQSVTSNNSPPSNFMMMNNNNNNNHRNQIEPDNQQAQDFALNNNAHQQQQHHQHPSNGGKQELFNPNEPTPANVSPDNINTNNPNNVISSTQSAKDADSQVVDNLPTPLNVVAPTTARADTSIGSNGSPASAPSSPSGASSSQASPNQQDYLNQQNHLAQAANNRAAPTSSVTPESLESMTNGPSNNDSGRINQSSQILIASNYMSAMQESQQGSASDSLMSATNRMGQLDLPDANHNNNNPTPSINDNNNSPASSYQPISGSPLSISVITPILGRMSGASASSIATQHSSSLSQNSLSTVVKPIYVLGMPLGERDYNHENSAINANSINSNSNNMLTMIQQQSTNVNANNQRNRAPKINDSPPANNDNNNNSKDLSSQMAQHQSEQQQQQQSSQSEGANEQQQFSIAKPGLKAKNVEQGGQQAPTGDQLAPGLQERSGNTSNAQMTTPAPQSGANPYLGDRMSGPSLIYTDGQLTHSDSLPIGPNHNTSSTQSAASLNALQQPPATPRLFQSQASYSNSNSQMMSVASAGGGSGSGAAVVGNNPRRPSLPPPVNQANAASGFRSPMSPSGPLLANSNPVQQQQQQQQQQMSTVSMSSMQPSIQQQQTTALIQPPLNSVSMMQQQQQSLAAASQQQQQQGQMPTTLGTFNYQTSLPPYLGVSSAPSIALNVPTNNGQQMTYNNGNSQLYAGSSLQRNPYANQHQHQHQQQQQQQQQQIHQHQQATAVAQPDSASPSSLSGSYSGRRPLNITRVEHISAECSNDLIRAVVVFNGTFKGIIYSSNYANDPTCLYINGSGASRYEFSIRLNQCGTMNKVEEHKEARRRDQVMWNSLSIQYNPIIEQEWDEHFKVSCEYGSDFWKTVSFSPFNVVTNTGSPVVFTINPPQCQMDVLLGHGIGPKIAVDGPVTVGDPLTLLIHMKSEKAGYDILVKNCVAHNGGKQRMQLIDSNGCVVNERFISPFRGTYNDNDLRHVTLYAYLKAFRFTGSPVLYLECEIHMCQSACPPQMCYWRRLSKRSADDFEYEYTTNTTAATRRSIGSGDTADEDEDSPDGQTTPVISDSVNLFKALQVRQEPEPNSRDSRRALRQRSQDNFFAENEAEAQAQLVCYRYAEVFIFMMTIGGLWLLICTVAIACCLRVRKITRSQFNHDRMTLTEAAHHHQVNQPARASLLSSSSNCLSAPSPSATSVLSGSISPSIFSAYAPSCLQASKQTTNLLSSPLAYHAKSNQSNTQSSFVWDSKARRNLNTKPLYGQQKPERIY